LSAIRQDFDTFCLLLSRINGKEELEGSQLTQIHLEKMAVKTKYLCVCVCVCVYYFLSMLNGMYCSHVFVYLLRVFMIVIVISTYLTCYCNICCQRFWLPGDLLGFYCSLNANITVQRMEPHYDKTL